MKFKSVWTHFQKKQNVRFCNFISKLTQHLINFISVPHSWTLWTRWSQCSETCGDRASRQRSRSFIPGRHGGKTEADEDLVQSEKCSESTELNPVDREGFPTPCPRPARTSPSRWESWSACTETCYPENSRPPMIERKRKCIPATLVDTTRNKQNWRFNLNINNCSDITDVTESKQCDIKPCPGNYNNTKSINGDFFLS